MKVTHLAVVCALTAFGFAGAGFAYSPTMNIGGYFRIMTRPDLQGGDGKLGYSNLYGRLLNEGPYGALELRLFLLEQKPSSSDVWTALHFKVEGGALPNADPNQGRLDGMRLSQAYVLAGNVVVDDVTWQIGTLDFWMGDLGLYDRRVAQIFFETVGASARFQKDIVDIVVGVGDSGYFLKGQEYNTILTAGGAMRVNLFGHVSVGAGGQFMYEPSVEGNRFAPYQTPGITYEDYVRGEVVENYFFERPENNGLLPAPESRSATSYKTFMYVGFGAIPILRWNNFFVSFQKSHPTTTSFETFGADQYRLYVSDFTDERYRIDAGNEVQFELWPGRLEVVWACLYSNSWDLDNSIMPSDSNMQVASTVARAQVFLTSAIHLLAETSAAHEWSKNGNRFRDKQDSIFKSKNGLANSRGLEFGDNDTRVTWQGKGGVVFNPLGPGVYVRPSLRLLYGVQYSTQNRAFGNSFVESLDQYNVFGSSEQHWHHVVALEAEAWF